MSKAKPTTKKKPAKKAARRKTIHEELEVAKDATVAEIKRAYRKKALKHHPDREEGDTEEFKRVTKAYQVLIDPVKRQRYEETGCEDEPRGTSTGVLASLFSVTVSELLSSKIDPSKVDLIGKIRTKLHRLKSDVVASEKEGQRRIKDLETIKARLTSESEDLLLEVLQSQIDDHNRTLAQHKVQLLEFQQCEEALENYNYEFEKQEQPKQGFGGQPMNMQDVMDAFTKAQSGNGSYFKF